MAETLPTTTPDKVEETQMVDQTVQLEEGAPDRNKAYKERWWEIRQRIAASGEVTTPTEVDELADAICDWEFGGDEDQPVGARQSITKPMLSGGYVKLRDIVAEAKKAWARPFSFEKTE